MSIRIPQGIVSYNEYNAPQNFSSGASKVSFSGKKDSENKKTSPAKIVLGVAAAALIIEGVIRYNPAKKNLTKQYLDVFDNAGKEARKLPTLQKRDEIIILEAAKGNKAAKKFFPTLDSEGAGIASYIKTDAKYKRKIKYYAEGHYDNYVPKLDKKDQRAEFFQKYNALAIKRANLYEKFIKPILPVNL